MTFVWTIDIGLNKAKQIQKIKTKTIAIQKRTLLGEAWYCIKLATSLRYSIIFKCFDDASKNIKKYWKMWRISFLNTFLSVYFYAIWKVGYHLVC